jgi:hypothetical protein
LVVGFTAELSLEVVMCNEGCAEPTLDELLGDVAIRLLMQSDDVTERDIRALLGMLKDGQAVRPGERERRPAGGRVNLLPADR